MNLKMKPQKENKKPRADWHALGESKKFGGLSMNLDKGKKKTIRHD